VAARKRKIGSVATKIYSFEFSLVSGNKSVEKDEVEEQPDFYRPECNNEK